MQLKSTHEKESHYEMNAPFHYMCLATIIKKNYIKYKKNLTTLVNLLIS